MAERKPLVLVGGKPRQLPEGDTLAVAVPRLPVIKNTGGIAWVVLVGRSPFHLPVTKTDGEIVMVDAGYVP